MILASVPWFLQDIATYGIGIFTPAIIGVLPFAGEDNFMAREMASTKSSAFVDLFLIAGFVIAVILIERVGRMKLQIVGFLGMAIGLLILAASNSFFPNSEPNIAIRNQM